MRFAVVVALASACSFEHGMAPILDDARSDGASDARSDGPRGDARMCPPPPASCVAVSCDGQPSCYYLCGTSTTGKQNWAGANGSCGNANVGCLVTIDSQLEQNCITQQTMPTFPNALVWIGWRQDPSGAEPADGWGWQCGNSSYVDPAWGSYEPTNSGGNEDCGALSNNGTWIDADCGGAARFLCELP